MTEETAIRIAEALESIKDAIGGIMALAISLTGCDLADVIDDIEDAPTVDAVEVVRCRDCEYWDPGSPLATVIPTPCRCRLRREAFGMTAEDFCSYGRRKTDVE